MLSCGIDAGSAQTKCVIMDGNAILQGRGLVHTGSNIQRATRHALKEALREASCAEYDLTIVVGTGYGRSAIPISHKNATETACHARGAIYRYPKTRTVLDIGGQDMTAIHIDEHGAVLDFVMNDKCAAGSGRYLESAAGLLGMTFEEFRDVDLGQTEPLFISNACSVFAEQEVINYLEGGKKVKDILGGVFMGIAGRGSSLIKRIGVEEEVTLTGGVSHVAGVVQALEKILGVSVNSGVDGVYIGALGAALIGLEKVNRGRGRD